MSVCLENKVLQGQNANTQKKSYPFWIARNFNLQKRSPLQWAIKRIFDLTASISGLFLISPVMLLIAAIIKIESKGPVLYKNRRTGLHGREFYLYKFRSMRQDAEALEDEVRKMYAEENSVMYKMDDDPRVTKVGKFLRKYSLDELPQLFNVIKGEMSLVGPRARATRDLALYKNWHFIFFGAIPGITGKWQTNGRSTLKDFDKVVKMEFDYIVSWNLRQDIAILLKTIPVVLFGKNTA